MCNHFFQTPVIYFQEYLKILMKWKCKKTSLITKFSQNIFKNKSKRKRNFIIYHFLVESKPHKRIDLLITASVNIYQTKKRKKEKSRSRCFCKSMTAYFNATHYGWAAKKIFCSRCSKVAILAFLKLFGKLFKTQLRKDL